MIDEFDEAPESDCDPRGYERRPDGTLVPTLETKFLERMRTSTLVNLANRPELWPVAAAAYAQYGRASAAAAAVGVTTVTVRNLWKSNEQFAAMMTEAHETYAAKVQDEIKRRAIDGVPEPVFYKGEIVGEVLKYSDALLVLEARRAHPEYREILATPRQGQTTVNVNTSSVAVASPAGQALASLAQTKLTDAQRAALRALLDQAATTGVPASEPVAGTPALLDVGPQDDAPVGTGGAYPGPHQEPQRLLPTPQYAPGTGHSAACSAGSGVAYGSAEHAPGSTEPVLRSAQYAVGAPQYAPGSTHHAATPALPSMGHGDRARDGSGAGSDPPEHAGEAPDGPGVPQDGSGGEPGR